MALVETRICDNCKVDSNTRAVHTYKITIQRDGEYFKTTVTFDLCNVCDDKQFNLMLQVLHAKFVSKRSYVKANGNGIHATTSKLSATA